MQYSKFISTTMVLEDIFNEIVDKKKAGRMARFF